MPVNQVEGLETLENQAPLQEWLLFSVIRPNSHPGTFGISVELSCLRLLQGCFNASPQRSSQSGPSVTRKANWATSFKDSLTCAMSCCFMTAAMALPSALHDEPYRAKDWAPLWASAAAQVPRRSILMLISSAVLAKHCPT